MLLTFHADICRMIQRNITHERLKKLMLNELDLKNEFVIILKPECFICVKDRQESLKRILEEIDSAFLKYQVRVLDISIFNGSYAASQALIENEYYVLNKGARYGLEHIPLGSRNEITERYKGFIPIGAYGFLSIADDYSAGSLEAITETNLSDKIGNGTYVLKHKHRGKEYAIINAFHPKQIEHFNNPNSIIMSLLCNTNSEYSSLANNMVGHYSPQFAREGSIRKYLYDHQDELGLTINNLYNGIHISPSPLEGIFGFVRYSELAKHNLKRTYLGKLLSEAYEEHQIKELAENPNIFYRSANASIFDMCEGKNAEEIARLLIELKQ